MPTITNTSPGQVVEIWGKAYIRGADGVWRPLVAGEDVPQGAEILTEQNTIVLITRADTAAPVPAEEPIDKALDKALEITVDRTLAAIARGEESPAAGLAGGADDGLQLGYRVERIVELVTPTTLDARPDPTPREFGTVWSGDAEPPAARLVVASTGVTAIESGGSVSLNLRVPRGTAADPDTLTITVTAVPTLGQVFTGAGTPVAAGSELTAEELAGLVYRPPADYSVGTPVGRFAYRVDNGIDSADGSTQITVIPVNDLPAAIDGGNGGAEDMLIDVALTGSDIDGTIAGVTVRTPPANGTLLVAETLAPVATGQSLTPMQAASLVFRPNAHWNGNTSFSFDVTDNEGGVSSVATITLTVTPVNDAPVAVNDSASTVAQVPVTLAVLSNDSDAENDALTVTSASVSAALGNVVVNADGTLSFTAAPDVTGPVVVTYTVSDGNGATTSATLTINVAAAPTVSLDAPALTNDTTPTLTGSSNLPQGSTVTLSVTDANGSVQTFTTTVRADGSYSVEVPNALAEGPFSALANVSGPSGTSAAASDNGRVDITPPVITVDAPVLTSDRTPTVTGTTDLPPGSTVTITVTGANGIAQLFATTVQPGGTFSIDVPAALVDGPFNVTASGTDAAGNTTTAADGGVVDSMAPAISVDAPARTNDSTPAITGTTDLPAGATVTLVVTGADGGVQTFSAVVQPDGAYSADVPAALVQGSFSVVASGTDAAGNSANASDSGLIDTTPPLASITIDTVTADNIVNAGEATGNITISGSVGGDVQVGDTVTLAINGVNYSGTVVAGSTFAIAVPGSAILADADRRIDGSVTTSDAAGNSTTATAQRLYSVNSTPIAVNDTLSIGEDAASGSGDVTPGGAAQDRDVDGDALSVVGVVAGVQQSASGNVNTPLPGTWGTLLLDGLGAYTYVASAAAQALDAGETVADVFTYTIDDGRGGSATATLTISVVGADDPTTIAGLFIGTVSEDALATASGALSNNDPDVGTRPFVVQSGTPGAYGAFSIDADGNWNYVLANAAANAQALAQGQSVTETFLVATDTGTSASITVTVQGANDAPVVSSTSIVAVEAGAAVALGLAAPSDVDDGAVLTITVTGLPSIGQVQLADGTPVANGATLSAAQLAGLRYVPPSEHDGAAPVGAFSYSVSDGISAVSGGTSVGVTPVNDAPTGVDANFTIAEDGSRAFSAGDFGFADVDVGDTLAAVRIDTLPAAGALTLNGTPVAAGQLIATAELPNLVFTPAANASGVPYASFAFSVRDSGGLFDAVPNTITLGVGEVNDPPLAVVTPASGDEDAPIAVSLAGTDVDGTIVSVTVATLPTDGTLYLADATTPVTVNTPLTPAQAASLVFVPSADFNGTANVVFTVTDDDGATSAPATLPITVVPVVDPTISIDDVVVNEAAGTATFTVSLNQATTATVSVNYATSNGTATAGSDYAAASGTLTFAPGVTTQTLTVGIADDAVFEGGENFNVLLSGAVNGTFADSAGLGTLRDDGTGSGGTDDDRPTLAVSDTTTSEGGFAVFTVSLSNPSTTAVTFVPSLTSGTATVGSDTATALEYFDGSAWQAVAGGVTIGAGSTSVQVRVATIDDVVADGGKLFSLTATVSAGSTANGSASGTATVTDDNDAVTVTLSASASVAEGGSIVYTATLGSSAATPMTVTLSNSAVIAIAAGATSGSVPFAAPGDDAIIDAGSVSAAIVSTSGGGFEAVTIDPTAAVTSVTDTIDSTTVSITGDAVVAEGATAAYTVSLTSPAQTAVTVNLAYSGAAADGSDFNGVATVTIPAGASSAAFNLATLQDTLAEGAESFTVAIASAAGGNFESLAISGAAGAVTTSITDDDTPTLSVSSPSITEGGFAVFTVALSNPSTSAVTFTPTLTSGTAGVGSDTATTLEYFDGSVWQPVSGGVTIAAGATSVQLRVATVDDVAADGGEQFSLTATVTAGLTANANATGTATINDDTDAVTVSLSASSSVAEGGTIAYTATLGSPAVTAMTVTLSNGVTITIPAGSASATTPFAAPGDDRYVDAGSVSATIASTSGGGFEAITIDPTAAVTSVTDTLDTTTATLSATPTVAEGGTITYTVSLDAPVTGSAVLVTLAGGQTITIPVGSSSGTATGVAPDNAYAGGGSVANQIVTATGGNFEQLTRNTAPVATTVTDDGDVTTVALTATDTVVEGGSITYTATLTSAAQTAATVTLSNGATITINAGDTVGTTTVAAPGDDVHVDAGNVSVTITTATGGGFENLQADATPAITSITDDSDLTTVNLAASASVAEGGTIVYTATLSSAAQTAVIVTLDSGETITIDAGTSSGSVSVAAPADDAYVDAGSVTRSITSAVGGSFENLQVGTASSTTTVTDTADATTISITGAASVAEGASASYTVSLTSPAQNPVTVNLAYSGTASDGSDFTGVATVTIPNGASSATFSVATLQDLLGDGAETLSVSIAGATGGNFESLVVSTTNGAVTTTIVDDDTPAISVSGTTVTEGGLAVFTVALSNPSTSAVTFTPTLTSGTAGVGSDTATTLEYFDGSVWQPVSGGVTIAAGATSVQLRVATVDDVAADGGEQFSLTATVTAGLTANANATGTATINDDTDAVTVSLSASNSVAEGGTITYTATLTSAAVAPMAVTLSNGVVINIAAGVTSGSTLAAAPGDDVYVDAGNVAATIASTSGGGFEAVTIDGTAAVTAVADTIDTTTLSIAGSATVTEGANGTYTVSLTSAAQSAVTVNLAYSDTAVDGSDYSGVASVVIAAGATSATFDIATLDDTIDELAAESFTVSVASATGGNFEALAVSGTNGSVTTTVTDNDGAPTLAVSSPNVAEGGGYAVFTLTLSNPSASATTVGLALANGSAGSADYGAALEVSTDGGTTWAAASSAIFAAGATSVLVRTPVASDTLDENDETFTLTATVTGGTTSNASAAGTATITDDDATPTLAINDVTVNEAAGTMSFTVTLSAASGLPVSVAYATSNGSAAAGADYTAASGSLNFAAGVVSQTITVAIGEDTIFEGSENFTVTLSAPVNATIVDGAGIGTVADNDSAPTIASVSAASAVEATSLVHTVTLSNPAATASTFSLSLTDGTASGGGVDYTSTLTNAAFTDGVTIAGGVITVPAGVTEFTVTVPGTADTVDEADETYTLAVGSASGIGTIVDDDGAPTVASVSSATQFEGVTLVHTVTLSNASSSATTFAYSLGGGSATGGGIDYTTPPNFSNGVTLSGGVLTVPAGVTSFTVSVPSTLDTLDEGAAETYNLSVGGITAIGTLSDDDAAPTIASVSSPTVPEGSDLVYAVTLSNGSASATTFAFSLGGGSATAGDYGTPTFSNGVTLAGGILTVPAGVTSFNVTVPSTPDTLDEPNETVPLTIGGLTGTGTITDDDATPTLAINDVSVDEAAGTATFTVTLSAASGQTVTVGYNSSNGSATAGNDYAALVPGTLTFAPGVTSQTITVNLAEDTTFEGAETFNVNLTSPTNATIIDGVGVGTISDNDTAPTIASVSSPTATEGSNLVYGVTLSNPSATATTFAFALGGGSATGADYSTPTFSNGVTLAGGVLSVPAGVISFDITLPTTGDTLDEIDETVPLTVGGVTAAGTITDDDAPPAISINDVSVNESAGTMTFTVTLSAASGQAVAVNYATNNANATAGADYTAASGSLTFAAGVTSQTITVAIGEDTIFEGSENFTVTLSAPVNATIVDGVGIGIITDNDAVPTLAVSSPTVAEDGGFAVFALSLSNPSATATTVSLVLADGGASGADYGAALEVSTDGGASWIAATSATFAAGATSVLVRTPVIDDTLDEPSESFSLTATRTAGSTSNASASGSATITDNDATPTLAINDVSVNEAAGTMTFTVTLSAASGLPVTVDFATANGTATAGADYTAASGSLTFAAGVVSQTVTVAIAEDPTTEGNEVFDVTLSNASNATIADGSAVGTITDNDGAPTLAVSSPNVAEGGGYAVFTLTLSNPSASATTVGLALANGSAGSADYGAALEVSTDGGTTWAAASSAIFAAGATSVLVRTPVASDTLDENDETFTLTATVTGGTTSNASAAGTATITDDDATPTLAINDVTVNEAAGTMSFTVTLSAASGLPVSVAYATSNGSAAAGADYTAASGSLNFAAGVVSQTITVAIGEDTIFEGSENFNVTLSAPVNATIADGVGSGTITDNDAAPTIASVSSPTAVEGTDLSYTVTLSNPSSTATTFAFSFGGGSAAAGDYGTPTFSNGVTLAGGILTVPAGVTSFDITLPTTGDTLDEIDETVPLTVGGVTAAGTITDNDAPPTININDVTVNEAAGTMTFTVSLSAASSLPISVDYATSNGTASAGTDYTAIGTTTLNFPAGVTSQTITVTISEDTLAEANETLTVTLSTPVNATLLDGIGVGTITDNDQRPLGRNATVTTDEDTAYTFVIGNFLMNDAEDGNNVAPSAVRIDTLPTNGSLFLNGVLVAAGQVIPQAAITAGQLTFMPTANANGSNYATFTFSVQDSSGYVDTAPDTLTVNVTPVSDGAPDARNDAFQTQVGTPITLTAAQLLSNDALPDGAVITAIGGSASGGALLNNGNGTYTWTPSAAGTGTFSYTLTDQDGQTDTAQVSIVATAAADDLASVHESALAGGTGAGTVTASGNLFANDVGNTSISSITFNGTTVSDGGAGDIDARTGYIGVGSTLGNLVVDVSGTGAGDYTYKLLRNADNSAAANDTGVTEVFNYNANNTDAALRVRIADDAPQAVSRTVSVSEDQVPSYKLVLVLDVSGSMDTPGAGGEVRQINADGSTTITTRLAMARQALATLVEEYYNQAQNVSITLVTFASTATIVNPGAPYTSKDAALAAILSADGSGGTNYSNALTAAQTAFGTVNTSVRNALYFVSDGAPSGGDLTAPATSTGYRAFVDANGINSYAVGIGSGIATLGPLNGIHNVDADGDGVADNAILVPDLNDLGSALLSTVPVAYGGNVVSGAANGNVLGADGGYIQSVMVRLDSDGNGTPDTDVTFTHDPVASTISRGGAFPVGFPISGDLLTLDAARGFGLGTLTFNFSTGEYTYFTGGTATEGDSFSFSFVARDGDGDLTSPTTLTVQIADGKPIARPDTDTLLANQTSLEGNVISGLGTDSGQSLGGALTNFSAGGAGADNAIDGAAVTSVLFKGASYTLTASASGSGTGFTWNVAGGKLTWTASSGGERLVFDDSGYYNYAPPTAALPTVTTAAAVTTNFSTAANAALNGVVLSGISRTGATQPLNHNNPGGTDDDGVGVTGGNANGTVDNLETLVVTFNPATHPRGVQGVSFVVSASISNLSSSSGTVRALTYTVFDVAGNELGQFSSFAEGTITVPSQYSSIGRIEIEANSAADARITSVSFASINLNTTATEVAPVEVGYTLTDSDGDSSSSTLTLRTMSNNIFGDANANTITGTNANDRIDGGAGNDTLNGGAGHDLLVGGDGIDTLNGGDGIDELRGGAGNDVINGGNGNDILVGGMGNDALTGGLGADVFRWELADRGVTGTPAVDTIADFSTAQNDVLDLRDLLQGETLDPGAIGNLGNYLFAEQVGSNTVLHVSSSGGFTSGYNAGAEDQTITLAGVDLTASGTLTSQQVIQDLLNNDRLKVDP